MKKIRFDPDKTFFTSDTHYNHSAIVLGTTQWITPPLSYTDWPSPEERLKYASSNYLRDFATIEKMNAALVEGINKTVGQEDTLFCLGDWSFGGIESISAFRNRLNCDNIHLIFGNHDHHIQNKDKNLQDLFSSVQYYREISVGKCRMVLSHYAHRIWNGSHQGSLHIYGHSHSNLETKPNGKSMDVGVDNAFKLLGEYRPFSFHEVKSLLDQREIVFLDHHNEFTN